MEKLSEAIDRLWERHTEQQRNIRRRTSDTLAILGQAEPEDKRRPLTTEEKDRIFFQEMLSKEVRNSSPYRRLKLVMDYWCALWFWPIERADLLPSHAEFLLDLSLLLEGNVFDAGPAVGEQFSMFPDTMPQQMALKLVDEFGFIDVDRLCRENERLKLVQELAEKYSFLHWELEFADVSADRGGFDLVLGNPPWIKVQWNEGGVIGDAEPLFVLRKYSASALAELRAETLERHNLCSAYLSAYEDAAATQSFLNAAQNYPELRGMQTNLYRCFVPKAWYLINSQGVASFVTDEGIFNDPNGGYFRELCYQRLKSLFQKSRCSTLQQIRASCR
ncbi:MAG: hypothetical protein HYZ72_09170 [Deltaproteobacteria bacterium]|nr:hypothetical protein [Deltaproteobacteria bacterium]